MTAIKTVSEFISKIAEMREDDRQKHVLFRGHSRTEYKFEPSVFRNKNWRQSEHLMLRHLLAENPAEFIDDHSTFDKLVRAQHYGLPTRLLDMTSNPLVALYFACCSNSTTDGEVLLVKTPTIRHKYFDSDAVSLIANLSFLKRSEKDELFSFARKHVDGRTINERVLEFEKCDQLDKLLQTVRVEKPHFLPRVDPFDLAYVVSVTPRKTHKRIIAQDGQFLIFGLNEKTTGEHLTHFEIERLSIPNSCKQSLIDELAILSISERTLFPEIEKSATQIKQKYR